MVDFEKFLAWIEERYGDCSVKGSEIKINSPFAEGDYKRHLWCNPYGGKKGDERPDGVYQCWKTGRVGTLVGLVAEVEGITYEEAKQMLEPGATSLAELEDQLAAIFSEDNKAPVSVSVVPAVIEQNGGINLPPNTYPIMELPEGDYYRSDAEIYLTHNRRLAVGNKMVCRDNGIIGEGDEAIDYLHRLIIPYYDRKHRLIYWNARYLGKKKDALRYLGPPKTVGVGKEDVIYMSGEWPEDGEYVLLTEGELDADTIKICGFNAAAFGGKEMFEAQAEYLRNYIPVLCVDNDKAGLSALKKVGDFLISQGFNKIFYIRPPKGFKDWNELLTKGLSPKVVRSYINKNMKKYNPFETESILMNEI